MQSKNGKEGFSLTGNGKDETDNADSNEVTVHPVTPVNILSVLSDTGCMSSPETRTATSSRSRRSKSDPSLFCHEGISSRAGTSADLHHGRDLLTTDHPRQIPKDDLNAGSCNLDLHGVLKIISQRLGVDAPVIESLIKQISLRAVHDSSKCSSKGEREIMVKEETPKDWLTREEAAHHLGVTPKTISNWSTMGKLRRHGLNGSRRGPARYFRADVEAALTGKKGTKK
jgi:hypothetical protein